MRVLHVIPVLSHDTGGPSRSCQGLVAALNEAGVDAWIFTLKKSDRPWVPGCDKFVCSNNTGTSLFDSRLCSFLSGRFKKDIGRAIEKVCPDIVHIHGVWTVTGHATAVVCRRSKIPYIISPRGMLEAWSLKQNWLKKRIARFLYQDRDLKFAAALHATAESEAEQFRRLGFRNRIIISPNGVNVPSSLPTPTPSTSTSNKARRALFVSRMHPKKGVLELVKSWARVKPKGWCCELVYTMNSDEERAYEQKIKDRILALGMAYQDKDGTIHSATTTSACDFILTGALDDEKKWEAYGRADLFILPTYSENFGIVVAEALWAGVPVITTKGTPWKELEKYKCGWWIDLPEEKVVVKGRGLQWTALDSALREAFKCSNKLNNRTILQEMGQRGHQLVMDCYTWSASCDKIISGYESIKEMEND